MYCSNINVCSVMKPWPHFYSGTKRQRDNVTWNLFCGFGYYALFSFEWHSKAVVFLILDITLARQADFVCEVLQLFSSHYLAYLLCITVILQDVTDSIKRFLFEFSQYFFNRVWICLSWYCILPVTDIFHCIF